MRLWLGNNIMLDAVGVLQTDGSELFAVVETPDGANLPNIRVWGHDGALLARLRRGAWVHHDAELKIETHPQQLSLSRADHKLVRLERHDDSDGVDAIIVTDLDLWSKSGLAFRIADAGPLRVYDREENLLVTFDECKFHRGFLGFGANPNPDEALALAGSSVQLGRNARGIQISHSSFQP